MTNNIRSDGKPAHVWVTGEYVGMPSYSKLFKLLMCANCGVLKGDPRFPETPCKEKVLVTLR